MTALLIFAAFAVGFIIALALGIACNGATYRNGCRDGFRCAHEPLHPACHEAGEVIRCDATLAHYLDGAPIEESKS